MFAVLGFVPEIMSLCFKVWESPKLLFSILPFLESLAVACPREFSEYLPTLLPNLMRALKLEVEISQKNALKI